MFQCHNIEEHNDLCSSHSCTHLIHYRNTDIEDITRWREDMNFMFEWREQYLTSERSDNISRALKKNIFFDVDIVVKNKSKCGLSWSALLPTTSTCHCSFFKHFFVLFLFCILSEFVQAFEGNF